MPAALQSTGGEGERGRGGGDVSNKPFGYPEICKQTTHTHTHTYTHTHTHTPHACLRLLCIVQKMHMHRTFSQRDIFVKKIIKIAKGDKSVDVYDGFYISWIRCSISIAVPLKEIRISLLYARSKISVKW